MAWFSNVSESWYLEVCDRRKESMLRRAKECVFGPGMSVQIKHITESCDVCQTYYRAQQRETLITIEANNPCEIVGVNLSILNDQDYLLC